MSVANNKPDSVERSAAKVGLWTGVSRVLGLAREVGMAYLFGTSLAKSAFDVAFTIPNLFRRLFGEGALSAAFVPVFTETLEKDGLEEANRLAGKVMTMLATTLVVLVVGGLLLLTAWMKWGAPGVKTAAVLPLLRIMFPYMFFICLVAFCMAMLNSFQHFTVPAMTPVVLNVVWILVLIFLCPRMGDTPAERITGVALGILAAGAIQFLFQIPILMKLNISPRVTFAWRDAKVSRILVLMGPAALGMGLHQVNFCIDRMLAMFASTWAPAALTYAERLIYFPLGIFATALGTVLLPTFSRQVARDEHDDLLQTLASSLRSLMLIMIPAGVGLLVLGEPIARLMYMWKGGEFSDRSALLTARAVWFYAPGLVAFSLAKVFVPAFYAMKDTRTPFRVGLYAVLLNLILNITFILTWPLEYKHAGLALATVLSSAANGLTLAVILHRRTGNPGWGRILKSAVSSLVVAAVMGVVVYLLYGFLCDRIEQVKTGQAAAVTICLLAGMAVYGGLASIVCKQDMRDLVSGLIKR